MTHVTTDLPCPRCHRHQAVEESREKQGESTFTCFHCGYQRTRERSLERYEAAKRHGDPTSDNIHVSSENYAPGLTLTEYEDGLVEVAPLPWNDPNGDAYRRAIHERHAHAPIVAATLRLKHPSANRWETHTITP